MPSRKKEIEALRRRAQWYRDFAAVGSADMRAMRLSLAKNFDRMADEREGRNALTTPDATPGQPN